MQAVAIVRPARIKLRSETLGCEMLSTIGYRAECRCGWQGPYRPTFADARRDQRGHVRGHRG